MPKLSNEIKTLMGSKEYKAKKLELEKIYFKLNGKYAVYRDEEVSHLAVAEISEVFKNEQIFTTVQTMDDNDEVRTKKYNSSFYDIWSFDPQIRTYHKVIFDCDVAKVPKTHFNLFQGFNHFNHLEKKVIDLAPIFEHIKILMN